MINSIEELLNIVRENDYYFELGDDCKTIEIMDINWNLQIAEISVELRNTLLRLHTIFHKEDIVLLRYSLRTNKLQRIFLPKLAPKSI